MWIRSLSARLILFSTIWTSIALLITALVLSTIFRQNAERNFSELLTAHLFNLIGSIDISDGGKISGVPQTGDPRFEQPHSGWYWWVASDAEPARPILKSSSFAGDGILPADPALVPFDSEFRREYILADGQSQEIRVVETKIFVGEGDDLFRFFVSGNTLVLEQQTSDLTRRLFLYLGFFGLGTILSTFVIIRLGLRPLQSAQRSLTNVREGRAERLEGEFPTEINPLIAEVNALISANRAVVARARTQVGNLAHALKTPLSVVLNDARSSKSAFSTKVQEQCNLMQEHVQRYLDRARIAALTGTISARTDVKSVVERMVRVMSRLNPHLDYSIGTADSLQLLFRGEEQDLEELLGNLVENASKYAVNAVRIEVTAGQAEIIDLPNSLAIAVEDDGPGLTEAEIAIAMKRGQRFDEAKPGSGLGLSIVKDISDEYGGQFTMQRSELGGLKAEIVLPAAARA